jgi:hypothetical protein
LTGGLAKDYRKEDHRIFSKGEKVRGEVMEKAEMAKQASERAGNYSDQGFN